MAPARKGSVVQLSRLPIGGRRAEQAPPLAPWTEAAWAHLRVCDDVVVQVVVAAGPALAPIIVPAVAVVAVGIVAATTSIATTRAQNKHALTMAREAAEQEDRSRRRERIDERRADVYFDLLVHVHAQRIVVFRIAGAIEDGRDPTDHIRRPPEADEPDQLALSARLAAFGSEEIGGLLTKWRKLWFHVVIASYGDQDEGADSGEGESELPTELDAKFAAACRKVADVVTEMERQIRLELQRS